MPTHSLCNRTKNYHVIEQCIIKECDLYLKNIFELVLVSIFNLMYNPTKQKQSIKQTNGFEKKELALTKF